MLSSAQIIPSGVVHTGDEAVRAAKDGALLLTTYRLPDMTGEELASRLGEAADVVMIVPQDYEGEEVENVIMLHNPISQDALVQSLKTLAHCRLRMQQLRARAEKLSRTLEERKLIDRAKGKLMDTLPSDRIRGALPHSESEHGFRQAHCRRCAGNSGFGENLAS